MDESTCEDYKNNAGKKLEDDPIEPHVASEKDLRTIEFRDLKKIQYTE